MRKVHTHSFLRLYVYLVSTDNAILLFIHRGSPLHQDRGRVEWFGRDVSLLSRYWNKQIPKLSMKVRGQKVTTFGLRFTWFVLGHGKYHIQVAVSQHIFNCQLKLQIICCNRRLNRYFLNYLPSQREQIHKNACQIYLYLMQKKRVKEKGAVNYQKKRKYNDI